MPVNVDIVGARRREKDKFVKTLVGNIIRVASYKEICIPNLLLKYVEGRLVLSTQNFEGTF